MKFEKEKQKNDIWHETQDIFLQKLIVYMTCQEYKIASSIHFQQAMNITIYSNICANYSRLVITLQVVS